jgi:hypothetical protein
LRLIGIVLFSLVLQKNQPDLDTRSLGLPSGAFEKLVWAGADMFATLSDALQASKDASPSL